MERWPHLNVLGSSHRLFKLGLGDVAPGLDGEKLAFRLDTLSEFGEEGGLARNLMHHVKARDKVELPGRVLSSHLLQPTPKATLDCFPVNPP